MIILILIALVLVTFNLALSFRMFRVLCALIALLIDMMTEEEEQHG